MEEASEFIRWASERRTLACDTETTGLSPDNDRIRTIQFGDSETGWCFPCEGQYSWAGLARDFLRRFDGTLVFHNSKFDLRFIDRSLGVGISELHSQFYDTSILATILYPTKRIALKSLASDLLGGWATEAQRSLGGVGRTTGWKWDSIPVDHPNYWQYAALDTVLTCALYEKLHRATRDRVCDLEHQIIALCYEIERRGLHFDAEYCRILKSAWDSDIQNITLWSQKYYGSKFNLFSNQQLASALVADGVELVARTPSGQYKMDESVIGSIEHPLARMAIMAKRLRKWSAVYLDQFLNNSAFDGRVHCSIRTIGARRTGRMSITDPPMQTLPRGAFVRDCFTPSSGNVLVSVDYDAMELRLAAHLSGDPVLIGLLESGESIHNYTARNIYGEGYTEDQRQSAKNGGYAIMFGGGARRVAHTIGVSLPEATSFREQWLASFPVLQAKIAEIDQIGRQRYANEGEAYVRTYYGRKNIASFDSHGMPKFYQLPNRWIQGSAADFLKLKMLELDKNGFGEYMVLPIHDELLFDIPANIVDEALPEIERIMTVTETRVPLTVHGDILYERWGDKYRGTDPDFDTGTFLDPDSDGED